MKLAQNRTRFYRSEGFVEFKNNSCGSHAIPSEITDINGVQKEFEELTKREGVYMKLVEFEINLFVS